MLLVKFMILTSSIYFAICQNEENPITSTKMIVVTSTTTLIPKTPETTVTTTTDNTNIIFDTPEKVNSEFSEACDDLSRTVNDTLKNFNDATKDKFNDEAGHIFRDLEREELYNLYQDYCTVDQLTAYEEFQTALDNVVKLWIDKEHPSISKAFSDVYKNWIEPFRRNVEVDLITPITTNLRFPKGRKDKFVGCANQYVPQIIKLTETAFTNVLDCYNMTLSYKETSDYADLISNLYKGTAEKFTTCNQDTDCFAKVCPEVHFLTVRSTSKASDAMASIIKNFQLEVDLIPKCASNKFNNAAYLATKNQLRTEILQCLK